MGMEEPQQWTQKVEKCHIEKGDAFSYRRCVETVKVFRQALGGEPEMVASSTTETVVPCFMGQESSSQPESSSRFESMRDATLGPQLGQMLEEFFDYATDLQRSLASRGALLEPQVGTAQSTWRSMADVDSYSSGGSWWGRWFARSKADTAANPPPGPRRPAQLAKEFGAPGSSCEV